MNGGESILSKYTLEERAKHSIDEKVNCVKLDRAKFTLNDAKNQVRMIGHEARRKPSSTKSDSGTRINASDEQSDRASDDLVQDIDGGENYVEEENSDEGEDVGDDEDDEESEDENEDVGDDENEEASDDEYEETSDDENEEDSGDESEEEEKEEVDTE